MSVGQEAQVSASGLVDLVSLERVIVDSALDGRDWRPASRVQSVVTGCLECWQHAIEHGQEWAGEPPVAVTIHAREAARAGAALVGLLDCYRRGHDLAWRAIMPQLVAGDQEQRLALARLVWVTGESLLDRVLQTIRIAYEDEVASEAQTSAQRQARLVWRLLSGDRTVDPATLRYDFDARHLGLAAAGREAQRALQGLSKQCGANLYLLPERDGVLVGWLGARRELRVAEVQRWLPEERHPDLVLAIGRCAAGLEGFGRTHRQAMEALRVAQRRRVRLARYADVELDALLLRDSLLARELIVNYIAPLEEVLLQTLRVCYACAWNESAAARDLGANRSTITRRLQRIEQIIGGPISTRRLPIELALRAAELDTPTETGREQLSSQQPAAN